MFLRELRQPPGILARSPGSQGPKHLARLGIFSISDLVLHLPRDYEDRTSITALASFAQGRKIVARVRIISHEWFGFGKMRTLKLVIEDDSSRALLICFNRAFLEHSFPPGSQALVSGQFQYKYGHIQAASFDIERLDGVPVPGNEVPGKTMSALTQDSAGPGTGGLLPVYPLTEGLTQKTLRTLMARALERYAGRVENELPLSIIEHRTLMHKAQALRSIHFPRTMSEAEEARKSLAWEELFYFQLAVARRALFRRSIMTKRPSPTGLLEKRFRDRLPFDLTEDQHATCAQIAADMGGEHPMARLLQGDVGSGKTLVALIACLHAVEAGGQAAMLAPTELLARQHAATAAAWLEPLGVRLAFLTGSTDDVSRRHLLVQLAEGHLDIVLGTHALFSKDVVYRKLTLVVVDEQHRFGVLQRMAMGRKGETPDLLMMTATPIPRTLAMTVYGDLEVSTIRTMPPGRKPVITHLASFSHVDRVYEFVRNLLTAGRQAYFVYPLVEESGTSGLKDAVSMAKSLAEEVFPAFKVGLIHSRLKEIEKRSVMDEFVAGRIDVLVATTVVEVGVDVPNAAVMVIEHAERFGLAALHQLRGRVGRGKEQSYCFLVYEDNPPEFAKRRLRAMHATTDGFLLAEEDMEIRGPGELTGTAQSGTLTLAIADPLKDRELLETARMDAFAIAQSDPGLLMPEHAVLRQVLERAPPFGESVSEPGELPGQ